LGFAPQLKRDPLGGMPVDSHRNSIRLCLIPLLALACSKSQVPQPQPIPGLRVPATDRAAWYLRQRDSLLALNPVDQATAALARGDRRLLGIVTLSLLVPGVGPNWRHYKPGILVFPGTGDYIASPEQGSYQSAAFEYAARYNDAIVRGKPCCQR
jgi:hypothetical protein